jgi:parvulin-like peptidyl-prolyl isomerase
MDSNLASIRRFYESQSEAFSEAGWRVDFSTEEGQKRLALRERDLLNKMIEDSVIEKLARQRGVKITPETVRQNVDRKLKESQSEEAVEERLFRLYGWDIEDFENKVVRPEMYREELEKIFLKEADTISQAKKKAEEALSALHEGVLFEEVAARYSEGATAREGGALGWVAVNDLVPEIIQAVKTQSLNQPGGIVESPLGFHILLVQEKKREKNQDMVNMRQIFVRKLTFAEWLSEQMKGFDIILLAKDYEWDVERSSAEFRDSSMRAFEEKLLKDVQGDMSLIP